MNYSQAISGVSAGYYERKDYLNRKSIQTDLHINKILEIVNEGKTSKLYRVHHIVAGIRTLQRERGMTEEQAAKHIRKAAEYWKLKGVL